MKREDKTSESKIRVGTGLGVLILVAASMVVYWQATTGEFIFDDHVAIVDNESIRQIWPAIPQLNTPFSARPIVNFSFAINYHFSELRPFAYRVTNIVLHVAVALLLRFVVNRTLRQPCFGDRFTVVSNSLAFASALLWLLHPVNSETVVYVTQRTELMMGLFYLATLACCIKFWDSNTKRSRSAMWLLASLFCTCGILCKETMATAPLVVLLYQWVFVGSTVREILRDSWTLYVGLLFCWVVIAAVYAMGYVTPGGGFGNSIPAHDWWLTQSQVVMLYLKLTVWPWPLLIHYEYPISSSLRDVWQSVLAVTAMIAATAWLLLRRSSLGFVMACFFIVLSPTLLIPLPDETVAERRMYVPLLAIVPLLVVTIFATATQCLKRARCSSRNDGFSLGLTALVVLFLAVGMGTLGRHRMLAYRTNLTLWFDTYENSPNDSMATQNVGSYLAEQGRLAEAEPYLRKAIELKSSFQYRAHFNLAKLFEVTNREEDAVEQYRISVRLKPDYDESRYNLARLLSVQGNLDQAIEQYEMACLVNPKFAASHASLGSLYSRRKQWLEAMKHFEVAQRLSPDVATCLELVGVYVQVGLFDEAIAMAEQGLSLARVNGNKDVVQRLESAIEAFRANQ